MQAHEEQLSPKGTSWEHFQGRTAALPAVILYKASELPPACDQGAIFGLENCCIPEQIFQVTAEDRARAIVAYFPAIPAGIRKQLEAAVESAIKRAVNQQLARLETIAQKQADFYLGRGKSLRNYDAAAMKANRWWASKLKNIRLQSGVSTSSARSRPE